VRAFGASDSFVRRAVRIARDGHELKSAREVYGFFCVRHIVIVSDLLYIARTVRMFVQPFLWHTSRVNPEAPWPAKARGQWESTRVFVAAIILGAYPIKLGFQVLGIVEVSGRQGVGCIPLIEVG
jgi:hypothetical protein